MTRISWWHNRNNRRKITAAVLVVLTVYVVFLMKGVLISFLLAGVLVYIFTPLVDRLEGSGASRTQAILLVYAAAAIVAAAAFLYVMPRMVIQLEKLAAAVPVYTRDVQLLSQSVEDRLSRAGLPGEFKEIIDRQASRIEKMVLDWANRMAYGFMGMVGQIFNIFLAPVLAFYLLKDLDRFKEDVFSLLPARWQNDAVILAGEINLVLKSYIGGYFLLCIIEGVLTGLAMFLLGLEFPLILGLFAGLTELIPYFGPFIGALPAVSLALLQSKWLALKVVLAFIVIQQLDANVLSPKILGNKVGLHPLAVILALLVGGELWGLTGMLLSVPLAAILKILAGFVLSRSGIAGNGEHQ